MPEIHGSIAAPTVRVRVVSDDRLFADGLIRILSTDPQFAIDEARATVLLLDSRMSDALSLCTSLRREEAVFVLLVAAPTDDAWASCALEAGARGLLHKSAQADDMFRAIRVVSDGLIWAPRRVMSARLDLLSSIRVVRTPSLLEERLSIREREVFHHAALGLGNKEVADRLAISEATVKVHLTHIFQKLGLHGRGQLAAAYHGIYDERISSNR